MIAAQLPYLPEGTEIEIRFFNIPGQIVIGTFIDHTDTELIYQVLGNITVTKSQFEHIRSVDRIY